MSELKSLSTVFSGRIYRIPDYQRGYAWGTSQLEDFWEDIANLPKGANHYTGMLSLEAIEPEKTSSWSDEKWIFDTDDVKAFYVVDGQQRLTTFVIFIQAFIDYLIALPENKGKEYREIVIGNTRLERATELYLYSTNLKHPNMVAYKFGYCDNTYNYLKKEIFHKDIAGSVEESFYTHNLSRAKKFFDDSIADYHERYGYQLLEQMFVKATNNMKFMEHIIEKDFDVYAAFETMNNRGKKLSNLELLKSRLIYLTTLYNADHASKDVRDTLRTDINEAWKEVYRWLGKNKEAPLSDNEFLRAHWIVRYPFSSKRGNDYVSFLLSKKFTVKNIIDTYAVPFEEEYADDEVEIFDEELATDIESVPEEENASGEKLSPSEITDYVVSLSCMSKHWYFSFYPNDSGYSEEEIMWIDRLNRIGIAYFRPLVVASFMREDIDSKSRINLLKEIERFIFIAFRLNGAYANYHQNETNKLVRMLHSKEIQVDDVIKNIRARIEGWVNAKKDFDTKPFISRIQRLYSDGGGFYTWGPLRYVLYEYEAFLTQAAKDYTMLVSWEVRRSSSKDISIEHIYPQTPDENSVWAKTFSKFDDDQKTVLRGSLGNLMLLSVSKNASLQNDEFSDKVNGRKNEEGEDIYKGYKRGSHSETDVATNYPVWDADAILKRGLEIMHFMEKRWDIKFRDDDAIKEVLGLSFV